MEQQDYNVKQGIKNIEDNISKLVQTMESYGQRIDNLEKNDIRIQSRLGIYQVVTPSTTAILGSLITYIIFK